ncbi:MAG: hypothetical protein KatS3mg001_375 [Candidatus Pacearchaeota archaeon]|nr:MAG: hypothetical protein KatS3mg001_375 [Candidatus Pacearchaeota archaeon]
MKPRNKKGELTTKQIVTLIILIVSFIVILFFIFRLNLKEKTDKEICRNSVVLRDQGKIFSGPLDCKTNYLCLYSKKECSEFFTEKIKIEKLEKTELMKHIAEEMADCRWMFGEDKKLRYTGGSTSTGVDCAICSIISFDEEIQNKIPEISYKEFYNFLEKNSLEEGESYLKYLYDVDSLSSLQIQEQFSNINIDEDIIRTSEKYSIITGIDNNLIDILDDDEWLNVYLIPTKETSQTKCSNFITKA